MFLISRTGKGNPLVEARGVKYRFRSACGYGSSPYICARHQRQVFVYLKADTLDDLLHRSLKLLLGTKGRRVHSTRGANFERTGILLALTNPRARLSRSSRRSQIFSCLGELAWYLAGSKSLRFIKYYISAYQDESEDGVVVPAAYGPRLLNCDGQNQIENVVALLRENRSSRRAVIQILRADDLPSGFVPCTCTIQFMIRGNRLHAMTHMRSNDAYKGLPHDVFTFTMIQEIIARELGVELGTYKHSIGSFHLYEENFADAEAYVDDGFQPVLAMPPMPSGSQRLAIREFLKVESKIRRRKKVDLDRMALDPYWLDLSRLVRVLSFYKVKDSRGIERQRRKMSNDFYDQYIEVKCRVMDAAISAAPVQHTLFIDRETER